VAGKDKMEQHIKKLEDLQTKIAELRQTEKGIQEKIISQLVQALHHHNGFSVPLPVLIGALINAIATYKNSPQDTGAWLEAGEKFLGTKSRKSTKKSS
jgi:hypothetical protein